MKLVRILALTALAVLFVSCGKSHNVLVVDPSGHPIADATIVPSTRSYSNSPVLTDPQGGAKIYQDYPYLEWLTVSKRGYKPAHVSYAQPKPMTVTLQPDR